MSSDSEVGRERHIYLARKEVCDSIVIFRAEEVADNEGEGEVVLRVEGGNLGEGRLESAIDIANDESKANKLLGERYQNFRGVRGELNVHFWCCHSELQVPSERRRQAI